MHCRHNTTLVTNKENKEKGKISRGSTILCVIIIESRMFIYKKVTIPSKNGTQTKTQGQTTFLFQKLSLKQFQDNSSIIRS